MMGRELCMMGHEKPNCDVSTSETKQSKQGNPLLRFTAHRQHLKSISRAQILGVKGKQYLDYV